MEKTILQLSRQLSEEFLQFVNKAISPFHAVFESKLLLQNSGFQELSELDNWDLKKGGKYYFTRNQSTVVAFTVGAHFDANSTGFKIIGAHTDSPCLRLAPISKLKTGDFRQTCVCTYGGGLFHTWFDRDLIVGGKVLYKIKDDAGKESFKTTLFRSPQAILKIPNLAIHLQSQEERDKFGPNKESHLKPIISSIVYEQLNGSSETDSDKHYDGLLQLIAKTSGIPVESIFDIDLYFADSQPSGFTGLNQEFISSPRLDNLFSSYFALKSILNVDEANANSSFVNMVCLFDHEECGSESFQGAGSTVVSSAIDRIYKVLSATQKDAKVDSYNKLFNSSFVISADTAHSVHPNYADRHKENHKVSINKGIVLKLNHNQRYATDCISGSILKIIAEKAEVPIQEFVVKNDSPCGSTIGPIISTRTGIKTVDIGAPQWGMHSIRETCGVLDSFYYFKLFTSFFQNYESHALGLLRD